MPEIKLTRGFVSLVDDADLERVSCQRWHAVTGPAGHTYAVSRIYYEKVGLSRFLLAPPPGLIVDHINGDTLDNRRQNLRIGTVHQNTFNCRKRDGTTSRFRGIHQFRQSGRWRAQIRSGGKIVSLGLFDAEEDAARAYDAAAIIAHGEFAKLNFPTPGVFA